MDDAYQRRRSQIEEYFDRTASETWKRLTSDAPVSRVRRTVRAGRDQMRGALLSWLPRRLDGMRLLDAGCGTGALAIEAARRGAEVVAVDVAPSLIEHARTLASQASYSGSIAFHSGDMLDPAFGAFDYVVAMDSLIHYEAPETVRALATLAERTERAMLFTHAPSNFALRAMHMTGKLFPRGDRSPAIVPVSRARLSQLMLSEPILSDWDEGRGAHISSGFYQSAAFELSRQIEGAE